MRWFAFSLRAPRSPAKRLARLFCRSTSNHGSYFEFGEVPGGGYKPTGSEREFAALFFFLQFCVSCRPQCPAPVLRCSALTQTVILKRRQTIEPCGPAA